MPGRRKVDRMALEVDEIAMGQLFDGLRALNRRYERALRIVAAALIGGFIAMGAYGYLLYHSGQIARTARVSARQQLARGTQRVAYDSCRRQNEHRAVEREILRRSMAATRHFAAARVIPPKIEADQLRELRRDIRALSDANCRRVAELIPLR